MKKIYVLILLCLLGSGNAFPQYQELSKTGWTVAVDNEETVQADNKGVYAIDEDINTIWHTDWDDSAYPLPHWIVVDFGKKTDLSGFTYTPRPGGGNGTIKTYAFFVSTDSIVWDSVAGGSWADPWDQKRVVTFEVHEGIRYMKLVAKDEANGRGWTSCAEFGAIAVGVDFVSGQTLLQPGDSVQFTDLSGNTPVAWHWYFEGGTPDTSTQQNPWVKYNTPGAYDVRLEVRTASGKQDTLIKKEYIRVMSPLISRTGWKLLYVDSEEPEGEAYPNGLAISAFDGDPSTYWHTKWVGGADPYPHTIVIDLGGKFSLDGFGYTPRPGGGNGTVKDYEFYILNEVADWTNPATWGTPVVSGTWSAPWEITKTTFFQHPALGRYIVFHALSEKNGNPWASCGELAVMGADLATRFDADRTEIFATQKVQFEDKSVGKNGWEWTFEGGTPATSTGQNPLVLYTAPGTYTVTLITHSDNVGTDTLVKEDFIVVDPRPEERALPKDNWSLLDYDSEEKTGEPTPNGFAVAAIDGNPDTYWHTDWTTDNKPYPHFLVIDLGETTDISGFVYTPRPGGGKGTVDSCMFLVSNDGKDFIQVAACNWSGAGDWDQPRRIILDNPVTGRYVRFVALSEKKDRPWASCAEIDVLTPITGTYFEADPLFVESGRKVYFLDLTAGAPGSREWFFEGISPPVSTEQSPVVTYTVPYDNLGRAFDVMLIAGQDTFIRENYITVNYNIPEINPGAWIDTFEIGKTLASWSGSEGGYVDHTQYPVTLIRGRSYEVRLGHNSPWPGYLRSRGLFVDWNRNFHFDEPGETVFEKQDEIVEQSTVDIFTLQVPANAVPGRTRLRVMATVYGDPGPYNMIPYGEMEDYTVNIVDDTSAVAPAAAFMTDTNVVCAGGTVHFLDTSENLPTQWTWFFEGGDPDSSHFATPAVTYPAPGFYSVTLISSNDHGSDTVKATNYIEVLDLPAVDAGEDIEVCPGSPVVLHATGGDSLSWNNGVEDSVAFIAEKTQDYVVTTWNRQGCTAADTVTVSVQRINPAVTMRTDTLIALLGRDGLALQWINCADLKPVEGAVDSLFVPGKSGSYAVVVTHGACTDTSVCLYLMPTDVKDVRGEKTGVWPNPNDGSFTVYTGKDHTAIRIYNVLGVPVYLNDNAAETENISLHEKGIYVMVIRSGNRYVTHRIVVR